MRWLMEKAGDNADGSGGIRAKPVGHATKCRSGCSALEGTVDVGAPRRPQPLRGRAGNRGSQSGKGDSKFGCPEPIRTERVANYGAVPSARNGRIGSVVAAGTGISPGVDRIIGIQPGGLHRFRRPGYEWPELQSDHTERIALRRDYVEPVFVLADRQ